VYLQLEAFAVEEGEDESTARKVGEANFAIFPRTNHPKVNVYADMEENMFRKEDVSVRQKQYHKILKLNITISLEQTILKAYLGED
jgi:hypothetical protein